MHNIGFFGHDISDFHCDPESVKRMVYEVVETIKLQYGKSLSINVDGEPGVGQIVADAANKYKIKYHMFLPCPPDVVGEYWYEDQKLNMMAQFNGSSASTMIGSVCSKDNSAERDKKMVDSSNFVICFWNGKHQGRTFSIIKYALSTNKLVLNGLNDLKLVSAVDMKTGKKAR
jgi:hypothetical protein